MLTNQSIKVGRRARSTRDYGEKSQKHVKAGWISRQFKIKILKVRLMNTAYFICILKNWTWACDHLKSSNLSADTFKKLLELRGSIPDPAIRSGDTGQQKHWYACGADRRKVGWSVYGHVIAEFSRMDRFSKLWGFELSPWSNKILAENLKKYVIFMVRKMSLGYNQVMMVSGYSSLTAAN